MPLIVIIATGFLMLQGWWMILNAQYFYDFENERFVPIPSISTAAPGAVDTVTAIPAMIRITGLLGVLCFVCDLSQRPAWRQRVFWTIGITGATLILYGLIRRIIGNPETTITGQLIWSYFANYIYNANAGAFINLVLPPMAGLIVLAFRKSKAPWERMLWLPGLLLCFAGSIIAASKGAMAITLFLTLVLVVWQWRFLFERFRFVPPKIVAVYALIGLVAVSAVVAIGWRYASARFEQGQASASANTRMMAYGACLKMLPDTGAWGFGPSNFAIAFPHYTNYLGDAIRGVWDYAHEDYLQTLIEWGWVGAAVWGVLLFGAIGVGFWNYSRLSAKLATADRIFLFTAALALLGVAIHAAFDFPLQIASLQLYAVTYAGMAWGSLSWAK